MTIVLANGCFDPLHYGHLLHLEEARRHGDLLVVAITSDRAVQEEKGPRRPVFDERARMRMVRALKIVDGALIVDSSSQALRMVRPEVFVKGADYEEISPEDRDYCDKHGIRVVFTKAQKFSSTDLLRHLC